MSLAPLDLGEVQLLVLVLALQRLAELGWSLRNERRLRARGGIEHGAAHYPAVVALHAGLLATLFAAAPAGRTVGLPWLWVLLGLQPLRLWVLWTLKDRWTTRVIVPPGEPLVTSGPYRWLRHPNYLVVALEVPVIGLAARAPLAAAIFGALNLAVLAWRVRIENAALDAVRAPSSRAPRAADLEPTGR